MRSHGHLTAEDLAKTCASKKLGGSPLTTYRSLRELLEAGVIREQPLTTSTIITRTCTMKSRITTPSTCADMPLSSSLVCTKIRYIVRYLEKQGFKVLGHERHC